ncbi:MAG: glycosyltransferase family 4 protein [Armatimonadetes bacterium]|nr:glycosyltransferase family 4 protein [Armatimonadota bacterium]
MHITCLIDNLGSGGAQRQLGAVAVALARLGHEVDFVAYHDGGFYRSQFEQAGISVRVVRSNNPMRRILMVRSALRAAATDVVLAYLPQPCLYAELAALPSRRWGLVVSERLAEPGSAYERFPWRRTMHRVADAVVSNSHCNRLMIEAAVPSLKGRVVTIYNLIDLERFSPAAEPQASEGRLVLTGVGSYQPRKNPVRLVSAMGLAMQRDPRCDLALRWRGGQADTAGGQAVRAEMRAEAERLGITDRVDAGGECQDVAGLYRSSDAAILPSLYEGIPNVVCEGMACGVPVLASDVADAGNLVQHGRTGFLFDPHSVESMAEGLARFASMPAADRLAMGREGRRHAEEVHDPRRILSAYESVLADAAARRPVSTAHWVPDVPESAVRTAMARTA